VTALRHEYICGHLRMMRAFAKTIVNIKMENYEFEAPKFVNFKDKNDNNTPDADKWFGNHVNIY
jgi:hypothetical protein